MKKIYNLLKDFKASYDFRADLREKLNNDELIIVHQMGKVGSTAIVKSLEKLDIEIPILHTHRLNPHTIDGKLYNENIKLVNYFKSYFEWGHYVTSKYLLEAIDNKKNRKDSWKIITLVREPVGRNISAFFQNIDQYSQGFNQSYDGSLGSIKSAADVFFKEYKHDIPLNWFDLEVKDVFGLDIYQYNFPLDKGYAIYRHQNIELLVIKLEDLDRCFQDAFKEFLNIHDIELVRDNIAADKQYSAAYTSFRKEVTIPSSYLDRMYSSKFVKHFYTDLEIQKFREKWIR